MSSKGAEQLSIFLAEKAGLECRHSPEPLTGGRNNRVFRLKTNKQDALLKMYFNHPDDPRDRMGNEFDFLEHLHSTGSRLAAKPLAKSPEHHAVLMEFIEGTTLNQNDIGPNEIEQASQFFLEANQQSESDFAISLSKASEACLSISEHLATTQRRIDRLNSMDYADEIDVLARKMVEEQLRPAWTETRRQITSSDYDLSTILIQDEKILSPSDFGFHNSLREPSGLLRFVDFEFAGWDDPAKLICDFRNQPDMLLEPSLTDIFTNTVLKASPNPEKLSTRVSLLEPVYQIKWACICLNDFLAWGKKRKDFTGTEQTQIEIKTIQLEKARMMVQRAKSLL